jgi:lipopolysaccharide export system permease protein
MKKLDRYISKNFIKAVLLSLVAFTGIFLLSQVFKVVRFVSDGRMNSLEALKYMVALLPKIIVEVTPLAVLLGALMSINRMAKNLEIISLKTAGISFKRIVAYPIGISIIISLAIFWIDDKVYPKSTQISKQLRQREKNKVEEIPVVAKDVFIKADPENYIYYAEWIDSQTGEAKNMEITLLDDGFQNILKVITAESGKFDFENKIWNLERGYINEMKETPVFFENYSQPDFDEEPSKFIIINKDPDILDNNELLEEIKLIKARGGDSREAMMQLAQRYAFPFASFVVVFLGLSLGSRHVRGGSAMNIALSVIFGYSYYVVQGMFEAVGKNGILNPFLAAWMPNILFLLVGLYFMNRAEY